MTKPFFFKVDGKHTVLNVFPASTEIRSVTSSESTSLGRPLGFLHVAALAIGRHQRVHVAAVGRERV